MPVYNTRQFGVRDKGVHVLSIYQVFLIEKCVLVYNVRDIEVRVQSVRDMWEIVITASLHPRASLCPLLRPSLEQQ